MSNEVNGVGDEMAKLIPDWAVQFSEIDCKCKDFQNKMNIWGPEGCEQRRDMIVRHLLNQEGHLIPILQAMPAGMKKIGANRMLTLAIRNARKAGA